MQSQVKIIQANKPKNPFSKKLQKPILSIPKKLPVYIQRTVNDILIDLNDISFSEEVDENLVLRDINYVLRKDPFNVYFIYVDHLINRPNMINKLDIIRKNNLNELIKAKIDNTNIENINKILKNINEKIYLEIANFNDRLLSEDEIRNMSLSQVVERNHFRCYFREANEYLDLIAEFNLMDKFGDKKQKARKITEFIIQSPTLLKTDMKWRTVLLILSKFVGRTVGYSLDVYDGELHFVKNLAGREEIHVFNKEEATKLLSVSDLQSSYTGEVVIFNKDKDLFKKKIQLPPNPSCAIGGLQHLINLNEPSPILKK